MLNIDYIDITLITVSVLDIKDAFVTLKKKFNELFIKC